MPDEARLASTEEDWREDVEEAEEMRLLLRLGPSTEPPWGRVLTREEEEADGTTAWSEEDSRLLPCCSAEVS